MAKKSPGKKKKKSQETKKHLELYLNKITVEVQVKQKSH